MAATVALEAPSVNSIRIQRASRINSVERGRLNQKILTLEREKVRQLRLVNQDIRMVNFTLDFIQSSSGTSGEGMAPDDVVEEEEEEDELPCFMYGQRLQSRRFGKSRRSQSATSLSAARRASSDGFSTGSHTARPRSGPSRGTFMTSGFSEAESMYSDPPCDDDDYADGRKRKGSFSSDRGFSNPMKSKEGRRASSSRPSTSRAIPTSRLDGVQGFSSGSHVTGRVSCMPRQAFTSDAKRQSASTGPPQKQWLSPALRNSAFHKKVHEQRKDMHKERAADVDDKLKSFMSRIPARAY